MTRPSAWQWLLVPPGLVYRAGVFTRNALYRRGILTPRRIGIPVVSVGNLTLGGSGKTPFVAYLAARLLEAGRRAAVASRGYGGSPPVRPLVVSEGRGPVATAAEAGDEAVLLATMLPQIGVVVGTDRVAAARLARERLGAEVVILDDGFQHRALHRDLDLLLVAAETDLRGARMIPLGDLREPLRQIRRADAVVLTGPPRRLPGASEAVEALLRRLDHPVPVFPCERRHDGLWSVERGEEVPATALQGLRLLAFSGIARPGGFEEDLADLGIRPAASLRFRDHQPFGPAEIERIRAEARRAAADLLVTTEKDRMRLLAAPPLPLPLYTLRIRLVPREPEDLWGFAAARLFGSASREREAG